MAEIGQGAALWVGVCFRSMEYSTGNSNHQFILSDHPQHAVYPIRSSLQGQGTLENTVPGR